jgi:hypothetical protein
LASRNEVRLSPKASWGGAPLIKVGQLEGSDIQPRHKGRRRRKDLGEVRAAVQAEHGSELFGLDFEFTYYISQINYQ